MANEVMWALCRWFDEDEVDLIHPDDLTRYRQLKPYGGLFAVLDDEGEYTVIAAGAEEFRVCPNALRLIKPEASWIFEIGEQVAVKDRDYIGTVIAIDWHHKEKKPFYQLEVTGKAKSKRYWPDDLEPIPSDRAG